MTKAPLKYRKWFWAGWYARWEWRYKCHLCGRRGFTPPGFYKHLTERHGFSPAQAVTVRNQAVSCNELDNKRITISGIRFGLADYLKWG
jgi:hypothetical protein